MSNALRQVNEHGRILALVGSGSEHRIGVVADMEAVGTEHSDMRVPLGVACCMVVDRTEVDRVEVGMVDTAIDSTGKEYTEVGLSTAIDLVSNVNEKI